ncbi:MAG: aminoacyl-histidine dipeptidase [Prolixibacteraceae bacterium]|nr:aminoacyl-histidine dipeptidase [Prolixibacteraceae bacterium]
MGTIKDIEPVEVWRIFNEILRIPRPSGHEDKIQDWAVSFGKNLGLETIKDESGNILIRKPPAPGMEKRAGVILQGHLDMVPQKNSDKNHDFLSDPIEGFIDGEWVRANGTTLGADNGIGVASAMAVLSSGKINHGPLEVLLTATEETGMDGASGLKPGILKGEILINTDSEDEGELYIGCAGGKDVNIGFSYTGEKVPESFIAVKMSVTGLKGGHSGIDIIRQRGNAIKVFFRILNAAYETTGVRISMLSCGGLRNAIPREAFGLLVIDKGKLNDFKNIAGKVAAAVKAEFADTDPGITVSVEEVQRPAEVMDEQSQLNLIRAVTVCPNGVIRMSSSMEGLVETSSNLAVVNSDPDNKVITGACMVRSSVDSAKDEVADRIKALFEMAGAEVSFSGEYPGWKPDPDSPILKTMKEVYKQKFGIVPKVKAIHAGLECGILGGKYPEWDMISFGPTIRFPHSPDEKVNIESVKKFWEFLIATLENIPEKPGSQLIANQ